MDQWIGNLFYRRVAPSEIHEMDWSELHYWNEWHELMVRAERPE